MSLTLENAGDLHSMGRVPYTRDDSRGKHTDPVQITAWPSLQLSPFHL